MITEAARRGQAEKSLVNVDFTVARAHHDGADTRVREDVSAAPEEAARHPEGE